MIFDDECEESCFNESKKEVDIRKGDERWVGLALTLTVRHGARLKIWSVRWSSWFVFNQRRPLKFKSIVSLALVDEKGNSLAHMTYDKVELCTVDSEQPGGTVKVNLLAQWVPVSWVWSIWPGNLRYLPFTSFVWGAWFPKSWGLGHWHWNIY